MWPSSGSNSRRSNRGHQALVDSWANSKGSSSRRQMPPVFPDPKPTRTRTAGWNPKGSEFVRSSKLYGYARSLLGTLCVCVKKAPKMVVAAAGWLETCSFSPRVHVALALWSKDSLPLHTHTHSFAEGYACCARVRSVGRWLGSLQGRSIHSFIRPLMLPSICRVSE